MEVNQTQKVKIAITGANGFIGRYLISELKRRDIHYIEILRPRTGKEFYQYSHNVIFHNILDQSSVSFEELGSPDILIHLAWEELSDYQSLGHFERQLPRHYLFLKNLVESGLKNIVVSGTCLEYGKQSGKLNEMLPTVPSCSYGFAKNTLRHQLEFLKKNINFNLTWARLFYIYGEGQSTKSLYSQLKTAVNRGDKTFNMSSGEQLRDYISVESVVKYLVCLALKQQDIGIINICSGNPISVRKLVEKWIQDNKWEINLNLGFYPYPTYEDLAFWGDVQKLHNNLSML